MVSKVMDKSKLHYWKTKIYDIDTLEFKTRWEKSATSFVQKNVI
jgi:hypothetical protein